MVCRTRIKYTAARKAEQINLQGVPEAAGYIQKTSQKAPIATQLRMSNTQGSQCCL
jgi:hypothetical protein